MSKYFADNTITIIYKDAYLIALQHLFVFLSENPDRVYHIDAEVMKTKTSLKAYRDNKQNNLIEDVTISAELKPHNILKSSIRWNPHLFREFNVSIV